MGSGEDDQRGPPLRFYSPDGSSYWTAERPADESESLEAPWGVQGSVVRFLPVIGGGFPLWDEDGPLPDDPAWLREHLGLEEVLVTGLAVWGHAYDNRDAWSGSWDEWREEGQRLFEAVEARLPDSLKLVDRRAPNEK